jgi:hypothetical protein
MKVLVAGGAGYIPDRLSANDRAVIARYASSSTTKPCSVSRTA